MSAQWLARASPSRAVPGGVESAQGRMYDTRHGARTREADPSWSPCELPLGPATTNGGRTQTEWTDTNGQLQLLVHAETRRARRELPLPASRGGRGGAENGNG